MRTSTGNVSDRRSWVALLESAVRIGLVVALLATCVLILQPFIAIFAWAAIVATIVYPVFRRLERALNGRRATAAALLTLAAALVLVVPTVLLGDSLVGGVAMFAQEHEGSGARIPPPPDGVAEWPLIGPRLDAAWRKLSSNPQEALGVLGPHLQSMGGWLLAALGRAGAEIFQFILGVAVAGFVLARLDHVQGVARAIMGRIAGDEGAHIALTAMETVRSVSQGIIGVAVIQALLAGIGLLLAGVPGAGLWALLCLVLSVAQLGTLPVMAPAIVYVFATGDMLTAVLFAIWGTFVGTIDNVLKPLFFGRGTNAPVAIVFLGAIGGLLLAGLIGLFVGAVLLVLGYKILLAWLNMVPREASEQPR